MPVVPFRRLGQEDNEFKDSLGYTGHAGLLGQHGLNSGEAKGHLKRRNLRYRQDQ